MHLVFIQRPDSHASYSLSSGKTKEEPKVSFISGQGEIRHFELNNKT